MECINYTQKEINQQKRKETQKHKNVRNSFTKIPQLTINKIIK